MAASVDVLGVECFAGDLPSATAAVIDRAKSGLGGFVVFCNVHVLMTARRDSTVREATDAAWTVFPDGAPIAWLQRRGGTCEAARVGGPDLMVSVLDAGRAHGLRHAIFGSTAEVVAALESRLAKRFPGLKIVVSRAPAPGEENDELVLDSIAATKPDIVWCALGAPKQELWMVDQAHRLAPALVLGVGAAFDFHAGSKRRAPLVLQRVGLEWAFRLASEPRRLLWRYLLTNTRFIASVLVEALGGRVRARQGLSR
jgi:N-acetylglucosaminyldiphosphoundecaprenol N-acetyl-beta-D-mannosaminyltransferase